MTRTPDPSAQTLVRCSSLREFFRDSIDTAMESNRLTADHHTAHYVVNLLTLFARADAFHEATADAPSRKPLALMLADALDAPTQEQRCANLQKLGDVALFVAGIFADDLEASVVDLDYYVSMGGTAYSSLSSETRGTARGRAFGRVFAELGEKFQQFVDVLNDIRAPAAGSEADVVRQYELWRKTGSARSARLLREQGICLLTQPVDGQPH